MKAHLLVLVAAFAAVQAVSIMRTCDMVDCAPDKAEDCLKNGKALVQMDGLRYCCDTCVDVKAVQRRPRLRVTSTSVVSKVPTPAAVWSPNLNADHNHRAFRFGDQTAAGVGTFETTDVDVTRRRDLLCTADVVAPMACIPEMCMNKPKCPDVKMCQPGEALVPKGPCRCCDSCVKIKDAHHCHKPRPMPLPAPRPEILPMPIDQPQVQPIRGTRPQPTPAPTPQTLPAA